MPWRCGVRGTRIFVGPMLLAKDLAAAIDQIGRGGSLVLLATMQALAPFTSSLNYAAPKGGTGPRGREFWQNNFRGVRVNVVAPRRDCGPGWPKRASAAGNMNAYVSSGAIFRGFGRPEDIARARCDISFLEPDGYVTGQVASSRWWPYPCGEIRDEVVNHAREPINFLVSRIRVSARPDRAQPGRQQFSFSARK